VVRTDQPVDEAEFKFEFEASHDES
jgi:hypothetical protein